MGNGSLAEVFAQSLAGVPAARAEFGRMERASGSPRTIRAVLDGVAHSDVRPAARAISVPTLVIHTRDDLTVPIDNGRWLAENIPGPGWSRWTASTSCSTVGRWPTRSSRS
jgi:pimeloyl-ACP methyl ester carboxylesterase